VLDEAPALEELLHRLTATLDPVCEKSFEVVFVDDGSAAPTAEALAALSEADPRVVVVTLRRTFGKAAALAAGFAQAQGTILATLDGDLQDQPEELPLLIEHLHAGADLVTGRKRDRKDPVTRRAASWLFNMVASAVAGVRVRDVNSGLKVLRREVVDEIPLYGGLHRFLPVLARARGFRVEEVDVAHAPRRHGRSRYGTRFWSGLLDPFTVLLLTRYGKRPLHFFGLFGGLLTGLGVVVLGWLSVRWFFGIWIQNRPLFTIGVMTVILGIQCIFFGLLAELVILTGGSRDPGYSVRSVTRREGAPNPPASGADG
jgi:glycosyltransferase involved in cell wall biosynthesis